MTRIIKFNANKIISILHFSKMAEKNTNKHVSDIPDKNID